MQSRLIPACLAALACAHLTGAHAADSSTDKRLWLHLGVARITYNEKVDVSMGGSAYSNLPDAGFSSNRALVFDVGYELWPGLIASFMAGTPPTTTLRSPSSGGALGKVQYGPAILGAHYHWQIGRFKPYLGAGAAYAAVLDSRDAGLTGLKVDSAWGTAGILGFEYEITPGTHVYLDLRRLWLDTRGSAAQGAIRADIQLNPSIVSAGLGWRF